MTAIGIEPSPLPAPGPATDAAAGYEITRRTRRPWGLWLGTTWVGVVLLLAVLASLLPLPDPTVNTGSSRILPFTDWTLSHVLGTDANGRSVLSRLIFGARASLAVSFASVVVGVLVGGAIGMIAGYLRGPVDSVIGLLTDGALAFPGLIVLLAFAATIGPGISTLIIGLTFIAIPQFVRISRANTIRFADREFVHAAELVGAKRSRIMFKELLPNVVPSLLAYAVIVLATLIVAESSLSYLGVGIRPPAPSWGRMIADGQRELHRHAALALVPALTLLITVYALNLIGDWARSKFDVGDSRL